MAGLYAPRELLTHLVEQAGVDLLGGQQVPHDLWAAADLPALTWVDRVTLIVNQFDLTFEVVPGGRSVRLIPVPPPAAPSAVGWVERSEPRQPEQESRRAGERCRRGPRSRGPTLGTRKTAGSGP